MLINSFHFIITGRSSQTVPPSRFRGQASEASNALVRVMRWFSGNNVRLLISLQIILSTSCRLFPI